MKKKRRRSSVPPTTTPWPESRGESYRHLRLHKHARREERAAVVPSVGSSIHVPKLGELAKLVGRGHRS